MDNMDSMPEELFRPLKRPDDAYTAAAAHAEAAVGPDLACRQGAWRRLRGNKTAMAALVVLTLVFLAAVFGPLLLKYGYAEQVRGDEGLKPGWRHIFGTDMLGRDMLARILTGARISLAVGVMASAISLTIGVLYGGISGLLGGRADNAMMRIVDILYSVPQMLYVILLMVVMRNYGDRIFKLYALSWLKGAGVSLASIFIVFGLTYWIGMARIVRGQIMSLREQEYVAAARAAGAGNARILLRHLIPNCIGPILVTVALTIPDAIFTEAFLSFIGLGVDAPAASLGSLASDALEGIRSYFYLLAEPSVAICLIILAFNLLGDGLRDVLDPKTEK